MGLPAAIAKVTGSIKFDIAVPEEVKAQGALLRDKLGKDRLIWVAASTHEGEEIKILKAHQAFLKLYPDALLILVPRHPDRFAQVGALIASDGLKYSKHSIEEPVSTGTQVYLGDTMGELLKFYAACDVAFVGGSFQPIGGHNMLEAAVLCKPVIIGPHYFNFTEITQKLLQQNALQIVQDELALVQLLSTLAAQPALREKMGNAGFQVMQQNKGAQSKQLAMINQHITS